MSTTYGYIKVCSYPAMLLWYLWVITKIAILNVYMLFFCIYMFMLSCLIYQCNFILDQKTSFTLLFYWKPSIISMHVRFQSLVGLGMDAIGN
jgi:hypothetical protein